MESMADWVAVGRAGLNVILLDWSIPADTATTTFSATNALPSSQVTAISIGSV